MAYKDLEKKRQYHKEYYLKNKNKIKQQLKQYRSGNKEKTNAYIANRRKTDPNFKLSLLLRSRMNKALKGNYKKGSAVKDLGCTVSELKLYLENQFTEGMNWDNWSLIGWHLDHVIPLSSFNLQDRSQLLKAVHYTNLQPLWAEDNLAKSNKI